MPREYPNIIRAADWSTVAANLPPDVWYDFLQSLVDEELLDSFLAPIPDYLLEEETMLGNTYY